MAHYHHLLFTWGFQEILIVAIIILLLFGGRKIPELMRGLGKGMKEFKDASSEATGKDDTPSEEKKGSDEKKN